MKGVGGQNPKGRGRVRSLMDFSLANSLCSSPAFLCNGGRSTVWLVTAVPTTSSQNGFRENSEDDDREPHFCESSRSRVSRVVF
jgi:hypothetical protein